MKSKKKGEFVKVIRKPQSCGLQSKKTKSEPSLTNRLKRGRRVRTKFDKDLESKKVEGKYIFIPLVSAKELIDEIFKDGNLKNISVYYHDFDENEKREVVVLHLHNFNKSLIEIEHSIPKDLYNILDSRRLTSRRLDKEMKERKFINNNVCISQEEVDRLMELANWKESRSKNRVNRLMVAKVEEVRKEIEEIWKMFLKFNRVLINNDDSLKDDSSHLIDQTHSTLDVADNQNPLVDHLEIMEMKGEEAQETPMDGTTPSGNTSAQAKEKEKDEEEDLTIQQQVVGREEAEKDNKQDKVQEKGEQRTDNFLVVMEIDTHKDKGKRILLQISINFDKPIYIGQMSLAERLMVAATIQAQDSQDLLKSESEDNKLIEMSIEILQKVVLEVQPDPNSSPSGKLLQLINSNFESLEKAITKKVLDIFKEVRMQTFQKMIEDDRVKLNKGLRTISDVLSEGGKIYKSCLSLSKFTLDIDKQISVFQGKLDNISQTFYSNVSLASSIEGQVMPLIDQISSLNSEKERIVR